ncbi:MAG: CapA family protein [Candidatus Paceibacterota bacterium]|jgi:poly-gamma-glutamate synthesis protein (capsule biosynthesis protein)
MIKRLAVFIILLLFVFLFGNYFIQQVNWQNLATFNYVSNVSAIPVFLPKPKVNILAVGDMMFARGVYQSIKRNGNGDFSFSFANIPELKTDTDILIGNLEGPVTAGGKEAGNLYSFRFKPELIPVLKNVGFDLLTVANNHAGDWGYLGFIDSLKNLEANNLPYVGGGFNYASATEPVIIEKNGLKTGFLGFSDVGPSGLAIAQKRGGVLMVNEDDFSNIIKKAVSPVDNLIVTIHFGEEYQPTHNGRQQRLAHEAIDAGARVVIGHHPHVIQDDEKYGNGYIFYSLGNFIFDQNFSPETMQGLALGLELSKDGVIRVEKRLIKINNQFQPSFIK